MCCDTADARMCRTSVAGCHDKVQVVRGRFVESFIIPKYSNGISEEVENKVIDNNNFNKDTFGSRTIKKLCTNSCEIIIFRTSRNN